MDERTVRGRHERDIEDDLCMLRLQLGIARKRGYENMERRCRQDIEEVERELERARRR